MSWLKFAALCFNVAAVSACLQGSAAAQTAGSINVKSGAPTIVGSIGQFHEETCHTAALQAQVVTPPSHGTIVFERRRTRITNRTTECFGKEFDVQAVIYRSKPGFRGIDTMKVGHMVFNGRTDVLHDLTITVNVQ